MITSKEAIDRLKEAGFNAIRAMDILATAVKNTNKSINEFNRALRRINTKEPFGISVNIVDEEDDNKNEDSDIR